MHTIKLTPVNIVSPKNTLRVKFEFMHGDADGYSHDTYNFQLPDVPNKEELIGRIIEGINIGLSWIDEYGDKSLPFIMTDDCNSNIPIVDSKMYFIHEVLHKYHVEHKIKLGTVVETNDEFTIMECDDGIQYEIPSGEDNIAPETSIPVHIDGYQCKFIIDGTQIRFEGQGDHTCDNQIAASGYIDEVTYFDVNGTQFTVSGY